MSAVRQRVEGTGLYPLFRCTYPEIDTPLLSALVERWHEDTSSFHMPFGEMTITLDDVSSILHLPMSDRFYTPGQASREQAAETCVLLLGGVATDYIMEFKAVKTIGLRFGFLQTLYTRALAEHRHDHAARMWLLHLLGSTLFANKSGGHYTSVDWIGMLQHLDRVSEYAWGAIALATLYDALGHASRRKTKRMNGCSSLLVAWVFEHFPPTIIQRIEVPEYTEDQPRACKWMESRAGHAGLMERLVLFDEMTAEDVIWTPYEEHKNHRELDVRALYSGYIRTPIRAVVRPHLPERVLRQFGYVQPIPRHPSVVMGMSSAAEVVDAAYLDYEPHLIPEGVPSIVDGAAVDDYLDWYTGVSHRFIIPDESRADLSAVASLCRAVDLLEQGLEVDGGPPRVTRSRTLLEKCLTVIRDLSRTQGVAFVGVRGGRGRGRGGGGGGGGDRGGGRGGGRGRRGRVGRRGRGQ
ncbi:protein MAIN-LIKE 1-like [Lotus japonicus]|uniref:protein MAIN-LIKE 1-like n=1 Tax=Lotus japonicus TaxID=34305 RepID=UPI00258CAD3F|nr:protein MAIN-LIKE 1-like [Lotus japonicus]